MKEKEVISIYGRKRSNQKICGMEKRVDTHQSYNNVITVNHNIIPMPRRGLSKYPYFDMHPSRHVFCQPCQQPVLIVCRVDVWVVPRGARTVDHWVPEACVKVEEAENWD